MAKRKIIKDITLQPRLQAALERGLTDEMACAECGIHKDTFYEYIKVYPDFSDMVTRAKATALTKAVSAFASGLERTKAITVKTTEFKETRLRRVVDEKGNLIDVPYTYSKVTENKEIMESPPDWRAGEAWLKRRDAANWSDKLMIEVDTKQLETLLLLLKAQGIKASDVFASMIEDLALAENSTGNSESES